MDLEHHKITNMKASKILAGIRRRKMGLVSGEDGSSDWILSNGLWNDSGFWRDDENWID